jgi:hypothetical protein
MASKDVERARALVRDRIKVARAAMDACDEAIERELGEGRAGRRADLQQGLRALLPAGDPRHPRRGRGHRRVDPGGVVAGAARGAGRADSRLARVVPR